jgi:membrane protease YdiL (CAAX protease family)
VLTAKNWRSSEVVRLFVLLVLSFVAAALTLRFVQALLMSEGHTLPAWAMLAAGFISLHIPGLVLATFFLRQHGKGWTDGFGLSWDPPLTVMGYSGALALACLLIGYPLQEILAMTLEKLGIAADPQTAVLFLMESSWPERLFIGFLAVCIAPVIEEALFRGVLYSFVRDELGFRAALWISALLFGILHGNSAALIPLVLFGMGLALLYEKTGNLLPCILAHMLFNLAGFLIAVFQWSPFD